MYKARTPTKAAPMVGIVVSGPLVIVVMLAVNVVLYVALVFTVLSGRARRVNAENLAEAFKGLEVALMQAVPDLPDGFTWGDAVARLRSAGIQTNGMENALKGYEEYRYGGTPLPNVDFHEVVMVANILGGINTGKSGNSTLGQ
jgi:hypothetical protein